VNDVRHHEPCIGLLELSSIARGIEVTDAVLKAAYVRVVFARPFSPGKYAVLFTGEVDSVTSALRRGAEIAGEDLLEDLLVPALDATVLAALDRPIVVPELDAVGIVETSTIASAIRGADAARKSATVTMIELRLAQGVGGKSYFTLTGEVSDVEVATIAAASLASERGALLRRVVISRPHDEMRELLARHEQPL
jgi:microcompartment protein CcmL/EutN